MHAVQSHCATQANQEEGVTHLIELLEFVETEWNRHANSNRRTMRDLKIPSSITHLTIEGVVYRLGSRRVLWFEKMVRGYSQDRFYVTEAIDADGHPHQLHLDRSLGTMYDDVRLVLARPLDIQRVQRSYASGPPIRD